MNVISTFQSSSSLPITGPLNFHHQVPPAAYLAAGTSRRSGGAGRISGGRPPAGSPPGGGQPKNKGVKIGDLMKTTGVQFGTSGARGLAADMTDRICFAYTMGFLQHLFDKGELKRGDTVAIAGDFRPSTARIMTAVGAASAHIGLTVTNLGLIPSPAAALHGIKNKIPTIMVTGSHIPADRNGIKFNKAEGEILKEDEAGIREQTVNLPEIFDANGSLIKGTYNPLPTPTKEAAQNFVRRYTDLFGPTALQGRRIGVYQHSAVGRDMLKQVLEGLGAEVTVLGRSDQFIPVDTEAIREEDVRLAKEWATMYKFDAIVSTDGDSDRPLIAGRNGKWLRGDVLGILVAKFLKADSVSTPVSSNTALQELGIFDEIRLTRVGSPYVIAAMLEAVKQGYQRVVSYEANGGFLTATNITINGRILTALPTRDSFLPILAALLLAKKERKGVAKLVADLPSRFTWSNRLKNFPQEKSRHILSMFNTGDETVDAANIEKYFKRQFGKVKEINYTDGIRIFFENEGIVHLRPSGNAPEFRVYTEAGSESAAMEMNQVAMEIVRNIN